ncbi:MAG: phenylalanine--tRNA ligase subunit beta [Marinilabiliales bacterium]|nr:MAG: phenylalanine--tRNA ligase subunit beta [Marinilabiliales bacterium]
MKIALNWMKQYLETGLDESEIAGILTDIGLEVEGIETFESVAGGLEKVVVGEVVSCRKHPGADKLVLAGVNTGEGRTRQIVCGAPNVSEGQKVIVALPGSELQFSNRTLRISETTIRGEESEGMICAEDELGLGDSHEGIMVLDNDAVPGTPAAEYFRIEKDTVFEIGLTPNRIDAASHFGVARDLAARLGLTEAVRLYRPSVEDFRPDNDSFPVEIIIDDPQACKRYSGLTICGITLAPSPQWLQNRLRSIGLKPVNNVVDITNFVLHETGQPLHAFNASSIKGKKVIVGHLPPGSKLITLDDEEREIDAEDLIICNESEGMCIAGVLGGKYTGVDENTTDIFLESACFDPISVRKTARRHGISTDASFRFERGTDPSVTVYALKRAALLIKEIAGGDISSDVTDVYPVSAEPAMILLDTGYVNTLVGTAIPLDEIRKILSSLDFRIAEEKKESLLVEAPLYRVEVTRPADVVEEILRIYGYNRVPVPLTVHSTLSYSEKPDREKYLHTVAGLLSSLGFNEIMCNSLTRSSYYKELQAFPEKHLVKILNPLSTDLDSLRQTLLFGGLETILYNSNRKNSDLRLYEFGNVYSCTESGSGKKGLEKYSESMQLGLFLSGKTSKPLWNSNDKDADFFDIKAYVSSVFKRTGLDQEEFEHNETKSDIFSYGLRISKGKEIFAEFGKVDPRICSITGIKNSVFFASIWWETMVNEASRKKIAYSELPRFPEVRRDLAMELDREVNYSTIKEIAYKTEKKLLKDIVLFDIYEGEKIAPGKKSYAVSFILQDIKGTMRDETIDAVMVKLAGAFEREAGARIRK